MKVIKRYIGFSNLKNRPLYPWVNRWDHAGHHLLMDALADGKKRGLKKRSFYIQHFTENAF